jgi:hypothetical protein
MIKNVLRNLPVWDLLRNRAKKDILTLEGIAHPEVPGLIAAGIACTVELTWVNKSTIAVICKDIRCTIKQISDISWIEYDRTVAIESYGAEYHGSVTQNDDDYYDEVFPLDEMHDTINIAEAIRQAILLDTPVCCLAPGEEIPDEEDFAI